MIISYLLYIPFLLILVEHHQYIHIMFSRAFGVPTARLAIKQLAQFLTRLLQTAFIRARRMYYFSRWRIFLKNSLDTKKNSMKHDVLSSRVFEQFNFLPYDLVQLAVIERALMAARRVNDFMPWEFRSFEIQELKLQTNTKSLLSWIRFKKRN